MCSVLILLGAARALCFRYQLSRGIQGCLWPHRPACGHAEPLISGEFPDGKQVQVRDWIQRRQYVDFRLADLEAGLE